MRNKLICYLDFDDFEAGMLAPLLFIELIKYFPNFKTNLFTIARHFSINQSSTFLYCLHGLNHKHFEILTEAELNSWKGAKIYRAPYWQLNGEMYERLIKLGWKVMLNPENRNENKNGIYFNWNIKDPPDLTKPILVAHGHIIPYINGLKESMDRLKMLPKNTDFRFLIELENQPRQYWEKEIYAKDHS